MSRSPRPRSITTSLIPLLLLLGCSPGSGTGENGTDAPSAEEGPVPFDPEAIDETNYFDFSMADFTAEPLDPSGVEQCDLIPAEAAEEFLGPILEARPEDLVDSPGCRWISDSGVIGVFVDERSGENEIDAVSSVLFNVTVPDEEPLTHGITAVDGYPAATTESGITNTCSMDVAVSDLYQIIIQVDGPESGCDFTAEVARAVMEGFPPAEDGS